MDLPRLGPFALVDLLGTGGMGRVYLARHVELDVDVAVKVLTVREGSKLRGALRSVPNGQWEAAESLAFSRSQTLWQIILPQCIKRMIPPWMNWYAILTMATPIVSILGVEDVLNLSRQAIEAEDNHTQLLLPFYTFVLLIFFAYCYPIARLTVALERRYQVKL